MTVFHHQIINLSEEQHFTGSHASWTTQNGSIDYEFPEGIWSTLTVTTHSDKGGNYMYTYVSLIYKDNTYSNEIPAMSGTSFGSSSDHGYDYKSMDFCERADIDIIKGIRIRWSTPHAMSYNSYNFDLSYAVALWEDT